MWIWISILTINKLCYKNIFPTRKRKTSRHIQVINFKRENMQTACMITDDIWNNIAFFVFRKKVTSWIISEWCFMTTCLVQNFVSKAPNMTESLKNYFTIIEKWKTLLNFKVLDKKTSLYYVFRQKMNLGMH